MLKALLAFVLLSCSARGQLTLGCLGGCYYIPQNGVQLQACSTVGQQNQAASGSSQKNLISCQLLSTPSECNAAVSSPNQLQCAWIETPAKFSDYGAGSCGLKGGMKAALWNQGATFSELAKLKKHYGIEKIPLAQHQAQCLQHSWSQGACERAKDGLGERCGWCEGIDTDVFRINPPTTGICFQSSLVGGTCKLLKEDANKRWCLNRIRDPKTTPKATTESPKIVSTSTTKAGGQTIPTTLQAGSTKPEDGTQKPDDSKSVEGVSVTTPSDAFRLTTSSFLLAVLHFMF